MKTLSPAGFFFIVLAAAASGAGPTGYLGIQARSNKNVLEEKNASDGVTVTKVVENSPGEAAGVKEGDIILEANGVPVAHPNQLLDMAETLPVGSIIKLRVDRDQSILEITATTVARVGLPDPAPAETPKTWIEKKLLGIEFGALSPEEAAKLGLNPREGIRLLRIHKRSPLLRAGIKEGFAISQLNGETIHDPEQFLKNLEAVPPGKSIKLRIADENGRGSEESIRIPKPRSEIRKINIPLLFAYSREPDKSSLTLPLYLFKRDRTGESARYRILWFFTFETGRSDELLEVQ